MEGPHSSTPEGRIEPHSHWGEKKVSMEEKAVWYREMMVWDDFKLGPSINFKSKMGEPVYGHAKARDILFSVSSLVSP